MVTTRPMLYRHGAASHPNPEFQEFVQSLGNCVRIRKSSPFTGSGNGIGTHSRGNAADRSDQGERCRFIT